jgi:L-lactate dehydrogenase complex protein LldG
LSELEKNKDVRRSILASIRGQLDASKPFDLIRAEHHSNIDLNGSDVAPLVYTADAVERFRESLQAVGGVCIVVRDEAEAALAVQQIIAGLKVVAVSDSTLAGRIVASVSSPAQFLYKADAGEMFNCDAGITSAQWAVAETGTLVLESEKERHRFASLVPPIHVALISGKRVVHTLGEVLNEIARGGRDDMSRTITFITGPSRTSDIELTLAIGVHGPAQLFVIIIEEAGSD